MVGFRASGRVWGSGTRISWLSATSQKVTLKQEPRPFKQAISNKETHTPKPKSKICTSNAGNPKILSLTALNQKVLGVSL